MKALRGGLRSQKGVSSVELAIYTPVLFLLVFLIVQAGLVWHGNQIATAVAREVARTARAEGANLNDVEAWGHAYAEQIAGNGLHDIDVQVDPVGADEVKVTVRGKSLEIAEGVSPWVEQTVQGPIESFRPDL